MNTQSLLDTLRAQLVRIKPILPSDIPAGDNLRQDWGVDSLELVEFVARIEQDYRIMIPDQDLAQLQTLEMTADYIQNRTVPRA